MARTDTKKHENKNTSEAQREKQIAEIARRYVHGARQVDIAAELGVSQQQVSYDLKILRERWRTESLLDFDDAKVRELAKIDELERTYWLAWEDSRKEKKKTGTKLRRTDLAESKESHVETEARDGDPRYLQGVQWCIERRCKLLGLDAPGFSVPLDNLTMDQLERLARGESLHRVLAPAVRTGEGGDRTPEPSESEPGNPAT